MSLVSLAGEIVTTRQGLPPMASEGRIVLGWDGTHVTGVYPVRPRGIAVVRISATKVELLKVIEHPYEWDYSGTTGAFVAPDRVLFMTLSTAGIRQVRVDLGIRWGINGQSLHSDPCAAAQRKSGVPSSLRPQLECGEPTC